MIRTGTSSGKATLRPVFADPKMDLPFKKLLSDKGRLMEFLNALLRLPEAVRIVDLEYLSPEQLPSYEGLKLSILDVKCTDATGTHYVVEMQVFPVEGFEKRVVLNACKAYVEQLDRGEEYAKLSDVVAVTICNFKMWSDKVNMLSRWRVKEEESGETGLSQVQYVFLELPKLKSEKKPETVVEKWAYLFREASRLSEVPAELSERPFAQAMETLRRVNFTAEEWTEYEREKMAEQDFWGGLELARKQGFQGGRAEGFRDGETKGFKDGETKGFKDGETKGKAGAVVEVMKARGLAISPEQETTVRTCQDSAVLDRWLLRALTANSAADVLTES